MATVFHYMEVRQIDGKVDFIFDKGNEAPVNILWAYDSFVNSAPPNIRRHIGALTPVFEDDKNRDFLQLQAADMLAWQARRHHRELMGLTSPRDDLRLSKTEYAIDIWDEGHLREMANNMMLDRVSRFRSATQTEIMHALKLEERERALKKT